MKELDAKLDPARIRSRLIDASLFLMAYELLKVSVVDGVKDFFISGFDQDGYIYSDVYRTAVLPRAKHVFEASLIFLLEANAITEDDKQQIQSLRDYRNKLAHDIPRIIDDEHACASDEQIRLAGHYLSKIDNFWGRVEVDTNPDLDRDGIDYEGIVSRRSLIFQYIAAIAKDGSA